MIAAGIKLYFPLIVLSVAFTIQTSAQICTSKYTSLTFQGTTYDTFTNSVVTSSNEIILTGKLYDYNSAGHIAKFSEKGSPIWSYQYNLDYYDFIKLIFFKAVNISDIISLSDGGYIVSGNVDQTLSPYGLPPPAKKWGLMAKMDKFGKVLWNKTLSNTGNLSFTNIYETTDGDYIAYLATDNGRKMTQGDHSYGKVLRITSSGKIKWSTFLYTNLFDAGGLGVDNKRAIVQAKNNNIVIGDVVHKTNPKGDIKEGNLHFFELDYNTGNLNWETSYEYPVPANDTVYLPDILNVKESGNGEFSFITTLYLPTGTGRSLVKKAVNVITNKRGVLQNILAYVPADSSQCRIISAAIDKNNGNRTLLIDNSGKTILANISDNGAIVWKQGYKERTGNLPANCFSAGKKGYNIFMSNNRSFQYGLFITDIDGAIDCVNEVPNLISIPAILNYSHDSVLTDLTYHFDNYYDYAYPLKRGDEYPLVKNIDCQQNPVCCTDIVDTLNIKNINICENKPFILPDGTVIKDSGLYYISYKTSLGCDSIKFYKVKSDKNVAALSLGNDTCLTGAGNIILKATEGYEKYYWMNYPFTSNSSFTITQPGKYYVRVDNVCGSKTDSIEIFDQCDYIIYMPSAFTPNNDRVNDYFRIAPSNKNKLINFSIYDRWGNLVFQTRNPLTGWNGLYKNQEISPGVYVYYIEMSGLSGNRITQKGSVMLIR